VSENDDRASDEDELQAPASPLGDKSRTDHDRVSQQGREHFRHTRISAAWVGVVVAIVFGVALIDFIAQNTQDVRIDFFSVSGRIPVAVALLVAALAARLWSLRWASVASRSFASQCGVSDSVTRPNVTGRANAPTVWDGLSHW